MALLKFSMDFLWLIGSESKSKVNISINTQEKDCWNSGLLKRHIWNSNVVAANTLWVRDATPQNSLR